MSHAGKNVLAVVHLMRSENCFANLPSNLVNSLISADVIPQNVVVEISWNQSVAATKRHVFVGWSGFIAESRNTHKNAKNIIEIDADLAKICCLSQNSKVSLVVHLEFPFAHSIYIEPSTPSDWEALEINAEFLENNFISQIRAVSFAHGLTIQLSSNTTASFHVTKIKPSLSSGQMFAKLSPKAEIVVVPKLRSIVHINGSKSLPGSVANNESAVYPLILRSFALPHVLYGEQTDSNALCLFASDEVTSSDMFRSIEFVQVSFLATNEAVKSGRQGTNPALAAGDFLPTNKVVARLLRWGDAPSCHVALSRKLAMTLGHELVVGKYVKIAPAEPELQYKPEKATVHPFAIPKSSNTSESDPKRIDSSQQVLDELKRIKFFDEPICHKMRVPALTPTCLPLGGLIKFHKIDSGWRFLDYQLPLEMGFEVSMPPEVCADASNVPLNFGADVMLKKLSHLSSQCRHIMLLGPKGIGKTALATEFCSNIRNQLVRKPKVIPLLT